MTEKMDDGGITVKEDMIDGNLVVVVVIDTITAAMEDEKLLIEEDIVMTEKKERKTDTAEKVFLQAQDVVMTVVSVCLNVFCFDIEHFEH